MQLSLDALEPTATCGTVTGRFGEDNPYLLPPRPRACLSPTGLVNCLLLTWLRVKRMKFLFSAGARLLCPCDLNFVPWKVMSGPVNSVATAGSLSRGHHKESAQFSFRAV